METAINIAIGVGIVLSLFVLLAVFFFEPSKLKTVKLPRKNKRGYDYEDNLEKEEMVNYYYLPKGVIIIESSVVISVLKLIAKNGEEIINEEIIDIELKSQSFKIEKEIAPDHSQAYGIVYLPNFTSKDELNIKINEKGLLENFTSSSEDRTPYVIEIWTKEITDSVTVEQNRVNELKTMQAVKPETEFEVKREPIKFTQIFYLDLYDFIKPRKEENGEMVFGKILKEWKIKPLNNEKELDVSFEIELTADDSYNFENSFDDSKSTFFGLLTRPVALFRFRIIPKANQLFIPSPLKFNEYLPHLGKAVCFAVRRSRFVKRSDQFFIENGMVRETIIEKPSEFEGFASIPVNIAKAIISIPTQVFNRRSSSVKRDIQAEKDMMAYRKVLLDKQRQELISQEETKKLILDLQMELVAKEEELLLKKQEVKKKRNYY